MKQLTAYYGISRQAFYKAETQQQEKTLSEQEALQMVLSIRYRQPQLGVRKLYHLLSEALQKRPYKIGRDALFTLLRDHSLLVKTKRRYCTTTDSKHSSKVYPNLLKDKEITDIRQVLISDITYIRRQGGFSYLSLVSDLYSRKILGYSVTDNLSVSGPIAALKMSFRHIPQSLRHNMIHHSDRGAQYASNDYTKILDANKIRGSMSAKGNPYDNAVMERMIGTLKREFLLHQTFPDRESIHHAVKQAVQIYNEERPHTSLHYQTPAAVYEEKDKMCSIKNEQKTKKICQPILGLDINSPLERG